VQALDLVGRKLPDHMGRPLRQFFHPLDGFIKENAGNKELSPFVTPLAQAFGRLQSATSQVALKGMSDFEEAGAASSDYLRLFALVALGFVWARMAKLALEQLANDPADPAFYERKVKTARFFFDRMLPETAGLLSMVLAGKDSMMAFAEEDF